MATFDEPTKPMVRRSDPCAETISIKQNDEMVHFVCEREPHEDLPHRDHGVLDYSDGLTIRWRMEWIEEQR